MTEKQFYDGISKPRNATLMRIFLSMGLTEHTGHGIPTIINKYGKEVFEIENNFIRCTIPFEKSVMDALNVANVGLNVANVGLDVALTDTERKVIDLLIENPSFKTIDIAEKLGVAKRTVERALKSLQEKEIIQRTGSRREVSWIVVK